MMTSRNKDRKFFHGNRMVPFVCISEKCPESCCGPFHGMADLAALSTPDDLGEIITGMDDPQQEDHARDISIFAQIRLLPQDVTRLRNAGLEHLIVRRGEPTDPAYYLRLQQDGSCMALRNGLCSIHAAKPTLCRAYPFYIDMFGGLSMIKCPGVEKGDMPITELREEIEAALEMYTFWIDAIRKELE